MKRTIKTLVKLAFIICFLSISANSLFGQVFTSPKVRASSFSNIYVDKVEITDKNTIVTVRTRIRSINSVCFSSKTYIVASDGGEPLYVQKVDGFDLDKVYTKNNLNNEKFKFYFPKIKSNIGNINFRAGKNGSYWHFFEIGLPMYIGIDGVAKTLAKGIKDNYRYVDFPGYTAISGGFLVEKIELHDTVTVLHFRIRLGQDSYFYIPAKSCIRDSNGGENLYVIAAEGATIGERKTFEKGFLPRNGEVEFKLFFPPIDKSVKKIDFREVNYGGNWFVYELDVDI